MERLRETPLTSALKRPKSPWNASLPLKCPANNRPARCSRQEAGRVPPRVPRAQNPGLVGSQMGSSGAAHARFLEVLPTPTVFHSFLVSEYLFKNRD